MTRVALDSNILIYAELEPDSGKGRRAADLILRAARDGVIPVQVLGEFLRFVQRRVPAAFGDAIRQASIYQAAFLTPPSTDAIINKAAELAHAHHMQFWDCVVCTASSMVCAWSTRLRQRTPGQSDHCGATDGHASPQLKPPAPAPDPPPDRPRARCRSRAGSSHRKRRCARATRRARPNASLSRGGRRATPFRRG